jgi:hypothetical protein
MLGRQAYDGLHCPLALTEERLTEGEPRMFTYMTGLWIVWGVVTVLLVSLIGYRSVIGIKEDDQLFLDTENPTEGRFQAEQQAILLRVNKLTVYIKGLWVASGAILLFIAGVWIYRGVVGFTNPSLEP